MDETIYVIGHKNPDTDSICAAISYAHLKQAQGSKKVLPARAGSINLQTEFVLDFFGVCAPKFLPDVVAKVNQAMTAKVISCQKKTSLKEILRIMEEKNVRMIPLINKENHYHGMVSLFDIAHEFRKEANPKTCRKIFTSIEHINKALGGKLLYGYKTDETFEGEYLVGAMEKDSFVKTMSSLKSHNCLLITGDRTEIQKAAIKSKIRALIVSGGLCVDKQIEQLAETYNVNLIISPYDTATTVGLVRLSTPAYKIAQRYDGYLYMDEHLENARLKILKSYNRGLAVLDETQRLMGIITMADLLRFPKTKLIMVDHNEISQAVDGIEEAEILEVIDHHRLGNLQTIHPILFINQPVGSTCTLVAGFFFEQNIKLDTKTAGLLASGIISDTLNLKSPTATSVDKQMLDKLNRTAKLNLSDYANKMLSAGVSIVGRSLEEIIINDFKEYEQDKINLGVGQIEVIGFSEFEKLKIKLIDKIKEIKHVRGYNFAALLVTDISTSKSLLIFDGTSNLTNRLGYPILEPHLAELKGILSRKKQLLPHLLSIFKEN